ncbi:MAG: DUF624 domain-containing protein [Ruminococcus sp.]|jgi:uncharacterized membrane protein YesL|nr:DUF624 domain-containing protein [Ruminococcus sp.]
MKKFLKLYFKHFWKICELNFIFFFFCVPVFTIGPAIAGITKVMKNYSQDEHAFMFIDFWQSFKNNFLKSLFIGIVDLIVAAILFSAFYVYISFINSTGNWIWYIALIITTGIAYTFIMMNFYIFIMIVSVELKIKDIVKNSFALTVYAIKANSLAFFACVLSALVLGTLVYFFPPVGFLLLFFPFTYMSFVINFLLYPYVDKYIVKPFYEENTDS